MRNEQLGLTAAAACERMYGSRNTPPAITASKTGTHSPINSNGERRRRLEAYIEVSSGFERTRGFVSIFFQTPFNF
jgi:hypothetical protein